MGKDDNMLWRFMGMATGQRTLEMTDATNEYIDKMNHLTGERFYNSYKDIKITDTWCFAVSCG